MNYIYKDRYGRSVIATASSDESRRITGRLKSHGLTLRLKHFTSSVWVYEVHATEDEMHAALQPHTASEQVKQRMRGAPEAATPAGIVNDAMRRPVHEALQSHFDSVSFCNPELGIEIPLSTLRYDSGMMHVTSDPDQHAEAVREARRNGYNVTHNGRRAYATKRRNGPAAATRRRYVRAWKAWRKSLAIRSAMTRLGYGRNGPVKRWCDECRIMLARAERAHRQALRRAET